MFWHKVFKEDIMTKNDLEEKIKGLMDSHSVIYSKFCTDYTYHAGIWKDKGESTCKLTLKVFVKKMESYDEGINGGKYKKVINRIFVVSIIIFILTLIGVCWSIFSDKCSANNSNLF